jgi:hypothetical protein
MGPPQNKQRLLLYTSATNWYLYRKCSTFVAAGTKVSILFTWCMCVKCIQSAASFESYSLHVIMWAGVANQYWLAGYWANARALDALACTEQVTVFEEVTFQICRRGHCSLWWFISGSAKAIRNIPSCETMKMISLYLLFCIDKTRRFVLCGNINCKCFKTNIV